ncbi:glutamate--tRNA ligase family protein [Chitinophaga sp. HK235]|uniref:glutamate--tRNA ligase family protein n=1 Tax=Chitinophaga sp. HK235 TaxID=2952571 RepID=UPI001BA43D41|nr:glutamate--tRNA ligase family protein [Chitinophaga sp. HK235]
MYQKYHRTRIAPTPSGYLHLGNVLSFVLTATLARRHEARILLRIDDLDQPRVRTEYVQDIFDTLDYLEIPWQEGPRNAQEFVRDYSQLHRVEVYRQALESLKEQGRLFACNCTRSGLQAKSAAYNGGCQIKTLPWDSQDVCWRVYTDDHQPLSLKTYGGVLAATLPSDQEYFVVRKKDGHAAYQLTSLVDDDYFKVDLIVRGEDLWASTLAQLHLARLVGIHRFGDATFFHHTLLMDGPEKKLSKSEGATSVRYLRKEGKTRSHIYTLIANRLGVEAPVTGWEELGNILLDQQLVFRQGKQL